MSQPTAEPPGPYVAIIDEALREADAAGRPPEKVATIKTLRRRTALGLKEAKEAVEDYGRRQGVGPLALAPNTDRVLILWVVILALLGLAAWWVLAGRPMP